MGAACVLCLWETTGWNACHLLRCHISFMHEKMCFSKLNTEQLKRANSVMWCGAMGGGGVLINSWNFPQKLEDGNLFIYNLETGVLWPKHLVFVLKKNRLFCPSLLTTRTREWSPSCRDNGYPPIKTPLLSLSYIRVIQNLTNVNV